MRPGLRKHTTCYKNSTGPKPLWAIVNLTSLLHRAKTNLALAFSLPELWTSACRSVEDFCLEKNMNYCSPVEFRLVPDPVN